MRLWIPALLLALAGCAHSPPEPDAPPEPEPDTPLAAAPPPEAQINTSTADDAEWGAPSTPFDRGDASGLEERDPWEGFNRRMFGFNEFVDRYALKPAAKSYRWLTPQWLDNTVTRFFANLRDIGDSINYVLQWRWREAGHNMGRFALNSTVGLAGLFDVASDTNLRNSDTGLDVTLGRWGVPSGPYLVLPVFGPSTVRDAGTLYPSAYLWPPTYIEDDLARYGVAALYGVDLRADLLELEKNIVGDRYTFIRNFYLQRRMVQIEGVDAVAPPLPDQDPAMESDDGWE